MTADAIIYSCFRNPDRTKYQSWEVDGETFPICNELGAEHFITRLHSELGVNAVNFNSRSLSYFAEKIRKELEEETDEYFEVLSKRFNKFYGPFANRDNDWYVFATADKDGVFGGSFLSLNFCEKDIAITFTKGNPEDGLFDEIYHKCFDKTVD